MLKKITLIATVAVLLIGAGMLSAKQDEGGNPQPEPKPAQKGPKNYKGRELGPQMFDKWLDALAKAHQENDMEKMGELIKKMQQVRQEMQKARKAAGRCHRDLREGCRGRRHQGRRHEKSDWGAPQAGTKRFCPGLHHRGFGRRGHCTRRRDQGGWNPRGLGKWHQGCPDMNGPMSGVPQRGDRNEPMQDTQQEDFNWD